MEELWQKTAYFGHFPWRYSWISIIGNSKEYTYSCQQAEQDCWATIMSRKSVLAKRDGKPIFFIKGDFCFVSRKPYEQFYQSISITNGLEIAPKCKLFNYLHDEISICNHNLFIWCIQGIHFVALGFGGMAEMGNKGSILSSNRHFNHW